MRPSRRAAFAAALILGALLAPQPAVSFDGPGCEGRWTTSRSCTFRFDGLPITVFADSESSGPVRVWVTIDGYPQAVLVECSGTGSCEDDLRTEEPLQGLLGGPIPGQLHGYMVRLRCSVQGIGPGDYFCGSGEGQDPP